MNTKRVVRWGIVLFLLAVLPVMTVALAQEAGEEPPAINNGNQAAETPAQPEEDQAISTSETSAATTTRVSVSSTGVQGNNSSDYPDISEDGRFVAFASLATNLVPGDTNGKWDVFVRDLVNNTTQRVSVNSSGKQANGHSKAPAISADGRFVVFSSEATNLVAGDTNGKQDIFVHDRNTGLTTRVSVSSSGIQGNGISENPDISANGRYVTFDSLAVNIVPGDPNDFKDVFLHDRQTGTTVFVPLYSEDFRKWDSSRSPSISADGSFIAYYNDHTLADMLMGAIYLHDRQAGSTSMISGVNYFQDDSLDNPDIASNNRFITYQGNRTYPDSYSHPPVDIYIYDRQSETNQLVSVNSTGSLANQDSTRPSISSSGRFVTFDSIATNLTTDTNSSSDVFLRDTNNGTTILVSLSSSSVQGNKWSHWPAISDDGQKIVFASLANNLVSGDTNGKSDIFIRNFGGEPPPEGPKILVVGDSITFGQQQLGANYPLGDPNVDNVVNQADLDLYIRWLNHTTPIPPQTTPAFKRADTDGNGVINAADKANANDMVLGHYPQAYFGVKAINKTLASFRLPLYQLFSRQTNYAFDFVGTVDTEKTYNFGGYPSGPGYPWPAAADLAFIGQSGKTAGNVNSGTNPLFGLKPALAQLKNQGNVPDVVLLHLGTVDINRGITWTATRTALNGIITKLRTPAVGGNAAMNIYIAQIIPVGYPGNACRANITFAGTCARFAYAYGAVTPVQTFNSNLDTWCGPIGTGTARRCANLSTVNSPVYLVDQYAGFDMENWLISSDEVYPTRRGECQIGLRWYEALRATEYPNLPAAAGTFCNAYPDN